MQTPVNNPHTLSLNNTNIDNSAGYAATTVSLYSNFKLTIEFLNLVTLYHIISSGFAMSSEAPYKVKYRLNNTTNR